MKTAVWMWMFFIALAMMFAIAACTAQPAPRVIPGTNNTIWRIPVPPHRTQLENCKGELVSRAAIRACERRNAERLRGERNPVEDAVERRSY